MAKKPDTKPKGFIKKTNSNKSSKNGVSKQLSKHKLKAQSKATKSKIEKLNNNLAEIDEVRLSLSSIAPASRPVKALDASGLKEDLKKDIEVQEKNKKADNDLQSQLEMLTGMGL
ncbi:hypothetical protein CAAN3_03S03268 [[Candida] anglica]